MEVVSMPARWSGPGTRLLLLVLVLTLVAVPTLVLAQSSEQRPSRPEPLPADDQRLLDLAALTLTVEDLVEAGLDGYGIASGQERSLRATAEVLADNRGGVSPENIDFYAGFLEEVGWQRGYESGLAVLQEDDPGFFAQVVSSTIDLYATEEDADRAFTTLADPDAITIAEVEELSDTEPIGDDSRVWLVEGEAEDTGQPFRAVLAMFRLGTMEVGVGIYNWDESEPDVELAQALAGRLLERIEAAEPGPVTPLSLAAVTFGEPDITTYFHNYLLRDDSVIPFAGETTEELATRSLTYRNAIEVYTVNQVIPAREEGPADDGFYALWRYRFADAEAANDWLDTESDRFRGAVAELPIGDRAFAFSYAIEVAPEVTARGYVGYLLVGAEVAIMDARAVPELPLVSFAELLQFQAACMGPAGPCPFAEIPVQLRQHLPPEPDEEDGADAAGTPVAGATPVASPGATPVASPGATPVAAPPATPVITPPATPAAGDDKSAP
jgi:hypothetical protein